MNETAFAIHPGDFDSLRALKVALRTQFLDRPDWCDHCNHGDHAVCKEWFGPECKCSHETEETR